MSGYNSNPGNRDHERDLFKKAEDAASVAAEGTPTDKARHWRRIATLYGNVVKEARYAGRRKLAERKKNKAITEAEKWEDEAATAARLDPHARGLAALNLAPPAKKGKKKLKRSPTLTVADWAREHGHPPLPSSSWVPPGPDWDAPVMMPRMPRQEGTRKPGLWTRRWQARRAAPHRKLAATKIQSVMRGTRSRKHNTRVCVLLRRVVANRFGDLSKPEHRDYEDAVLALSQLWSPKRTTTTNTRTPMERAHRPDLCDQLKKCFHQLRSKGNLEQWVDEFIAEHLKRVQALRRGDPNPPPINAYFHLQLGGGRTRRRRRRHSRRSSRRKRRRRKSRHRKRRRRRKTHRNY